MPQTKEQRKFWASKRSREQQARAQVGKTTETTTVLLATNLQEYKRLRIEYPDMRIKLDTSAMPQLQLFDTLGMKDV